MGSETENDISNIKHLHQMHAYKLLHTLIEETQTPDWETNKLVDQIRAEGLPMLYPSCISKFCECLKIFKCEQKPLRYQFWWNPTATQILCFEL